MDVALIIHVQNYRRLVCILLLCSVSHFDQETPSTVFLLSSLSGRISIPFHDGAGVQACAKALPPHGSTVTASSALRSHFPTVRRNICFPCSCWPLSALCSSSSSINRPSSCVTASRSLTDIARSSLLRKQLLVAFPYVSNLGQKWSGHNVNRRTPHYTPPIPQPMSTVGRKVSRTRRPQHSEHRIRYREMIDLDRTT